MDYQNLVVDFAKRTERNLQVIEDMAGSSDERQVYEVTQLINSMLGLLVFPQQKLFHSIPETPLETLREQGWPIPHCRIGPSESMTLKGLLRYMRNGISHFNIEFVSDNGRNLTGIMIWNYEYGSKPRRKDWEVTLDLTDLRFLVKKFIEQIEEWDADVERNKRTIKGNLGRNPGK